MPPLRVPDDGLLLSGGPGEGPSFPTQAFAVTLSDDVIEDLISCFQNGEGIQLALGNSPTLHYGSNSHTIPHSPDPAPHDFYLTQPFESLKRASKVPNTMCILSKAKSARQKVSSKAPNTQSSAKAKPPAGKPKVTKSGASSGLDSDIEALQNSLAQAEAQKTHSMVIDSLPRSGKAAKGKSKLLSGMARASSAPRSMPTSPAISASGGSPSLGPVLSASQQAIERAKEQRITLIHELAAEDRTFGYLEKKWTGKDEDFGATLRKVADFNDATQRWAMSKTYWKELDVWNYEYSSQEERQRAIDNAIRQYDKMRLSPSQPHWEKLLPREERGKGKCLSRLQANLTRGPRPPVGQSAPTIKVQKATDGGNSSGREEGGAKAVGMARSTSNPLPPKKKMSEREAQQKRLLARKTASAAKAASPKKGKGSKAQAKSGGKILSEEFIEDSDSDSEDQALAAKPKAPVKETVMAAAAPAKAVKSTINARAPVAKSIKVSSGTKRRREDDVDGDSSSSGTPLSKRVKQKPAPTTAPAAPVKHRSSDSSQNSRGSSKGHSHKNTSPAKSSPLASSPPTNASDLEQEPATTRPPVSRKRPAEKEKEKENLKAKRPRTDVPNDLYQKAHKFKMYYQKYEVLHHQITALENPPREKIADLLDMRERLQSMKTEIYRECPPARG